MSWSINFIGMPDKVVEALEAHSAKLQGQSRLEYDDAKPNLIGLVKQNFVLARSGHAPCMIKLDASGCGTVRFPKQPCVPAEATQEQRSCQVSIQVLYGVLT